MARSHQKRQEGISVALTYRWRHLIENFFAKIKEFRAIATRYEKTTCSYAVNWHLDATIIASR